MNTKQPVDYAFLHGGGQGSWVWEETIAALNLQSGGSFGRALALDVPGCGIKRGQVTEAIGPDEIAAELVQDIVTAGLRDVVLIGHSQAGTIVPLMIRQSPGLFRRVVYVSCMAPLAGQTNLALMGSHLRGVKADEVGWPVDPATHTFEQRYTVMFCNDMGPHDTTAFLAKLGSDSWPARTYTATDWHYDGLGSVPAIFVVCLRDESLPAAWQMTFASRVHASQIVRIDAGHQVMNTRPHALAEVLRQT